MAWSFHNGFNSVLPNKSRYWPFEFVFPDLLFQIVKDSCGQAFPSTGMKGWGVVEVKVFISPSRLLTVISTQPQSAPLKQTNISLKITAVVGSPQWNSALWSQEKGLGNIYYCLRIHQKFFKNETVNSLFWYLSKLWEM